MNGKIIDEILDAEKRAADIKNSALLKASELKENARLSGEALCKKAAEDAEARKKALREENARISSEFLNSAKEDAEKEARFACAAASASVNDAVSFIISKVGSLWQ